MERCKVAAPAKINLTLDITGRRADGYHELVMIMQAVDLCDTVELTATRTGDMTLKIEGADLTDSPQNTARRAAQLMWPHRPTADFGVHITLHKQIPMQAGLAGGSADAAAVLVGLNTLWGAPLSSPELSRLAAQIGADVPFCLCGGAALATGIGTDLQPLTPLPSSLPLVIAKPAVGVSTAAAYAAVDGAENLQLSRTNEVIAAMRDGRVADVAARLNNAFAQALDLPEVAALTESMRRHRPLGCCMSGSGSAVFALFETETAALRCAATLHTAGYFSTVCHPTPHGAVVVE